MSEEAKKKATAVKVLRPTMIDGKRVEPGTTIEVTAANEPVLAEMVTANKASEDLEAPIEAKYAKKAKAAA